MEEAGGACRTRAAQVCSCEVKMFLRALALVGGSADVTVLPLLNAPRLPSTWPLIPSTPAHPSRECPRAEIPWSL